MLTVNQYQNLYPNLLLFRGNSPTYRRRTPSGKITIVRKGNRQTIRSPKGKLTIVKKGNKTLVDGVDVKTGKNIYTGQEYDDLPYQTKDKLKYYWDIKLSKNESSAQFNTYQRRSKKGKLHLVRRKKARKIAGYALGGIALGSGIALALLVRQHNQVASNLKNASQQLGKSQQKIKDPAQWEGLKKAASYADTGWKKNSKTPDLDRRLDNILNKKSSGKMRNITAKS